MAGGRYRPTRLVLAAFALCGQCLMMVSPILGFLVAGHYGLAWLETGAWSPPTLFDVLVDHSIFIQRSSWLGWQDILDWVWARSVLTALFLFLPAIGALIAWAAQRALDE